MYANLIPEGLAARLRRTYPATDIFRLLLQSRYYTFVLVEVASDFDEASFQFKACRGDWGGRVVNGELFVEKQLAPSANVAIYECDQQWLAGKPADILNKAINERRTNQMG